MDSASFATSFDSYFENSFLDNLGLSQNFFDAEIKTTDGQFNGFNFELSFQEPAFESADELQKFNLAAVYEKS